MARTDRHPSAITEVLLEPGRFRLWVTAGDVTHLLDCAGVVNSDRGAHLRLPRAWSAVTASPDGEALQWPGLTLSWETARALSIAQMPPEERYRPLLPLLRAHEPPLYSAPVTPDRVQGLLSLRPYQLQRAAEMLVVEPALAQQRLYDVAVVLVEYVGIDALLPLLRRPWPVARRQQEPLLSMQDCLVGGRPDLVERAVTALILEGV